jgi:prepilin-type N-terminal cleavage/methylation domain-containing protein
MSRDLSLLTIEPRMPTLVITCTTAAVSPRSLAVPRRGFTLVELLIATVVLAVGLLALTSAGAAIVKLESRGQRLSRIASAGETRLELLRASGCASSAGQSQSGWLDERWSASPALPNAVVMVDTVRQGASASDERAPFYVFRSAVRC